MRRLSLILGLVLIGAMTVREVYEFFVANEGIRYFSSEPQRLLFVTVIGVAGGMAAFAISRLSPGLRRKLKPPALGASGVFLTGALGLFSYHLIWAAPMLTEAGMLGWMAAAFLSLSVVAGLVWLEFRQAWRRT